MQTWIIEPRDPLIVRDGRPFGPQPGARARSLSFPNPSTTTGGARTREGLDANGMFDTQQATIDRVKQVAVLGPLLVELDDEGAIAQWLVAAPADALLLEGSTDKHAMRRCLVPMEPFAQVETNLERGLRLVGLAKPDRRKPLQQVPRYWYWSIFEAWLRAPLDDDSLLTTLGHNGPTSEDRMHVSIDPETSTNVDGALFQTSGLEFTSRGRDEGLGLARRLALAVQTDAQQIKEGLSPLAGERRIVSWRQAAVGALSSAAPVADAASSANALRPSLQAFPSCPPDIRRTIVEKGHCRVILLTPAIFELGYKPRWLLSQGNNAGVAPTMEALAAPRYQVISGWDLAAPMGGQPKPTRRMLPAGSVLFLTLRGIPQELEKWVDDTWMHCISDGDQDRIDGFGLAALGTWDGRYPQMED